MRARILDIGRNRKGLDGDIKHWERDNRDLDVGIRTQANEQPKTYKPIP